MAFKKTKDLLCPTLSDALIAFYVGRTEWNYHGPFIRHGCCCYTLIPRKSELSIIMDYGTRNSRYFIDISGIAAELEKKQSGLSNALTGFHSLTGCDFTSSFSQKVKKKPFEILQSDDDNKYLSGIQSLNSPDVDVQSITAFVCRVYGTKNHQDIDEARYESFMKMAGAREGKY